MNFDIEDSVSRFRSSVDYHREGINEIMLSLQESIRDFEKMVTSILDDFDRVLSKQETLIKILSQLFKTTKKICNALN